MVVFCHVRDTVTALACAGRGVTCMLLVELILSCFIQPFICPTPSIPKERRGPRPSWRPGQMSQDTAELLLYWLLGSSWGAQCIFWFQTSTPLLLLILFLWISNLQCKAKQHFSNLNLITMNWSNTKFPVIFYLLLKLTLLWESHLFCG